MSLTLYKAKPEDEGRQQIVEGEIVARFADNEAARKELAELVRQARELNLVPQQVAQQIHNQVIRDQARVGTAIAGNVYGGVSGSLGEGNEGKPPTDTTERS